jgi:hypothetical protein
MPLEDPVFRGAALLALMLPGIFLAGRWLARWALADQVLARWAAPAAALALWLLAAHVFGRAGGAFWFALWGGTLGVGLLGYGVWAWQRWRGIRQELPAGEAPSRWLWVAGGLATVWLAGATLGWFFHDETWVTGHLGLIAQMHNDVYPPRHMNFAQFDLRYHYGFDLLCALLAAVFRLRPDQAIDGVTLVLWLYTWGLLWVLGDRVGGRGAGGWLAAVFLFGGNLACLAEPPAAGWAARLLGLGQVGHESLLAPRVSYFMQHPWSVGLPVAAALLLVFHAGRGRGRYVAGAALLLSLALCQIVLFLTLLGAVMAAELLANGAAGSARRWWSAAGGVAVGLAAWSMGGFFRAMPDAGGFGMDVRASLAPTWTDTLLWLLLSYGALLPLGLAGLWALREGRLLYAILGAGALAVMNFTRYGYSFDTVKFGTVAALALAMPTACGLRRWMSGGVQERAAPESGACAKARRLTGLFWARALIAALAFTVIVPGLLFPLAFWLRLPDIPERVYVRQGPLLEPDDVAVVNWLRRQVRAGEVVYRARPAAWGYPVWGGLPLAWPDVMTTRWGFSPGRIHARCRLIEDLPEDPDDLPAEPAPYLAQGLCWFVLGPQDGELNRRAERWLREGQAEDAFHAGDLRVVRLRRPRDPQARAKTGRRRDSSLS